MRPAARARTRSRRACGGRQRHALLAVGVRVAACGANAPYRAPGAAGGVVCTVDRRARWRAPRKGTQKSHSTVDARSTPPSRGERRRRVTTVSWRTAACQPPGLVGRATLLASRTRAPLRGGQPHPKGDQAPPQLSGLASRRPWSLPRGAPRHRTRARAKRQKTQKTQRNERPLPPPPPPRPMSIIFTVADLGS